MKPVLLVILVALLVSACDSQQAEPPACAASLEPVSNPQIVLGQGIDGIRMRDRAATVEQKLGPRDSWPIIDWCIVADAYGYNNGLTVILMFRMVEDTTGVGLMQAFAPYAGKTRDGLGIGASRAEVECIYGSTGGAPWFSVETDSIEHLFFFEADTVSSIQFFSRFIPAC